MANDGDVPAEAQTRAFVKEQIAELEKLLPSPPRAHNRKFK